MNQTRGVLYQATGLRRYFALCACSVRSLRWSGYNGPIRVLVENCDFPDSLFADLNVEFHIVSQPQNGKKSSRWIKTRLNEYSPFAQTLFLDCDIIVLNSIDSLWQEVGDADLALAPCYFKVQQSVHASREELRYTLAQGIRGVQYNGGVKVWRDNECTRAFFEAWNEEWQRFGDIDQLALLRALKRNPLDLHTLPSRFNFMEGDAVLPLRQQNIVFWHVLAGRDVEMFRAAFGALFEEKWRALGLQRRDVRAPHHALVRRNIAIKKGKYAFKQRWQWLKNRLH